jgi:hypothetical protein
VAFTEQLATLPPSTAVHKVVEPLEKVTVPVAFTDTLALTEVLAAP